MADSVSLAQLRGRIMALEGGVGQSSAGRISLGLDAIDAALPGGGAALAGLHEIQAMDGGTETALGFAALWLGRLADHLGKPVLWLAAEEPYGPGLFALGLAPQRLLMVRARRPAQLLWALETALHCSDLAGVLVEMHGLELVAARRLQLAARAGGVTALLVNDGQPANNALSRWRVGPAPAALDGNWRWRLQLCRCRGQGIGEDGLVAEWLVEWNNATHRLGLVAPAGHRSALPERHRRRG